MEENISSQNPHFMNKVGFLKTGLTLMWVLKIVFRGRKHVKRKGLFICSKDASNILGWRKCLMFNVD